MKLNPNQHRIASLPSLRRLLGQSTAVCSFVRLFRIRSLVWRLCKRVDISAIRQAESRTVHLIYDNTAGISFPRGYARLLTEIALRLTKEVVGHESGLEQAGATRAGDDVFDQISELGEASSDLLQCLRLTVHELRTREDGASRARRDGGRRTSFSVYVCFFSILQRLMSLMRKHISRMFSKAGRNA